MNLCPVLTDAVRTPYDGLVSVLSTLPVESLGKLRDATDDAIAAALRGLDEEVATGDCAEYESGAYHVGDDIPAGAYFATPTGDALLSSVAVKAGDGVGAPDRMVDSFTTCSIVGVTDGEYLIARGCKLEPLAYTRGRVAEADDVPEGMYLVGFHIPAGEYEAVMRMDAVACSVAVYADAGQRVQLAFYLMRNERSPIGLEAGDYVRLRGVTLHKRG